MGIFHFSDEALKGAPTRPRHAQHLEALQRVRQPRRQYKAVRSGRKIEQNKVPKPGPQNRQFCGDAWAYAIVRQLECQSLCIWADWSGKCGLHSSLLGHFKTVVLEFHVCLFVFLWIRRCCFHLWSFQLSIMTSVRNIFIVVP